MFKSYIFLLLLVFCSCGESKTDTLSHFAQVFSIESKKLNVDTYKIKSSGKISLVEEPHCIVKENLQGESLIDLIYFEKDSVIPFATLGNGPDEFIMPRVIQKTKEDAIEIYDMQKKQLITKRLSGERISSQEIKYQGLSLIKVNDGFVLSGNLDSKNQENKRYTLLDKEGKFVRSFGDYPEDHIDCPYPIKAFAYQGWMVYNSDLNRFASVSFSGAVFEIYQLQESPFLVQKYHDRFPAYSDKSLSKTRGVSYTKENRIGYVDIYATNQYIFTLYSGVQLEKKDQDDMHKAMSTQMVLVYDWDGRCICRLKTDIPLLNLCVSDDNRTLFALGWEEDYFMYSFDLSHIGW